MAAEDSEIYSIMRGRIQAAIGEDAWQELTSKPSVASLVKEAVSRWFLTKFFARVTLD
jgi:hypothetical protein